MNESRFSPQHRSGGNHAPARGGSVETDRLEAALRALPRVGASDGFTRSLLSRVAGGAAPRRSAGGRRWLWPALVAVSALAAFLAPSIPGWIGGRDAGDPARVATDRPAGTPLDPEQVRALRARRSELERELLALRRLASELPPVVGVEGPSADYLIDLGDLAPGELPAAGGSALPAAYRPRPR